MNTALTLTLTRNIYLDYAYLVDEIYRRIMSKLHQGEHKELKLSHALILLQLSEHGERISDIARNQAVSKQAIGQVANELERLGYIVKIPDLKDKRAKRLVLSPSGIALIQTAANYLREVELEFCTAIGEQYNHTLHSHSKLLFKQLHLRYPKASLYTKNISHAPLISHASAIATWLNVEFDQISDKLGHPKLKRSDWHILEHINRTQTNINELALYSGTTKQAISQLANDLEKKAYIERITNPDDKRSKTLALTSQGEALIQDTLSLIKQLEARIMTKLGEKKFFELKGALNHTVDVSSQQPTQTIEQQFQIALQDIIQQSRRPSHWLSGNRLSKATIDLISKIEFN